jgi:hypothetical protein
MSCNYLHPRQVRQQQVHAAVIIVNAYPVFDATDDTPVVSSENVAVEIAGEIYIPMATIDTS